MYDILIKDGLVFDGQNNPAKNVDVAIKDGKVVKIAAKIDENASQVIDAKGQWVTPGFIDLHTHYDGELLLNPSLSESVRHGVTTCFIGSCSISLIYSEAEDASDIFTRVESVPREYILPALEQKKTWSDAKGFIDFLNTVGIGPNVSVYVGHSDLRVAVLGMKNAVDPAYNPTEQELKAMEDALEDAINQGMLGMSSMTNPWDKLDGDRFRSASLPSVYAKWKEYRRLHKLLRNRKAILQSAPNLTTKLNVVFFLFSSASLFMRDSLKTTLITLMDTKADPLLSRVASLAGFIFNRLMGADFKWQALPSPFRVYSDGVDFIVFEEFPTGEMALHLQQDMEREALFKAPSYREQFKKDYRKRFGGRVWHRDFGDAEIIECPNEEYVGRSVRDIAIAKGEHEVDTFLDLIIDYGRKLRWTTVIANHRPSVVRRNIRDKSALIGFSDAGAHLRNMAFYNFPLQMLKHSRVSESKMTPEYAVWRLTGEIADWYQIDAGKLEEGARADIAIVDPERLFQTDLDAYEEAAFEELGGLKRIVNRHDNVVKATIINGKLAWHDEKFHADLGKKQGFGQYLPRR